MSTEILNANKEWLVWARESVHYDKETVAQKMKIKPEKLENWENTGELTYNNLVKLSDIYQVSPTLFFNMNPPEYDKEITDFRTVRSKKIKVTPNIMFELRRAKQKRETLLTLSENLEDLEIPLFSFRNCSSNDIDEISEYLKEKLNVKRANCKKKLDYWVHIIESLGVLVFEFYDINPKELRGYALYYDKLPIIGINHRETDNAKKFTLFHELAHLILKKEGISNINEYSFSNNEEVLCNKIASEVLLPSNVFNSYIKNNSCDKFRENDIYRLSKIFNVSKQVIVRKALDLGYITKKIYESRINEFESYINPPKSNKCKTKSKSKPKNNSNDKNENLTAIHNNAVIAINKNGNYFINLLFKAYDEKVITDLDLASELNVSLRVVDEIINIMWGAK